MGTSTANLQILFVLASLFPFSNSQPTPVQRKCVDQDGNYSTNSTYERNLGILLNSLSSNGSSTGYFASVVGKTPDSVYGLVLCRGDIRETDCQTCLSVAPSDIQNQCQFRKTATIWYHNCLLRYSNQPLRWSYESELYLYYDQNVTSDWTRFNRSLSTLMDRLVQYAAYNVSASPPFFATGQINLIEEFPKINGLVQCSRDLSADRCKECLKKEIAQLYPTGCACARSAGSTMFAQSCVIRFEVYEFYEGPPRLSLAAITAGSPLSPTMSPSSPILPPHLSGQVVGKKKNATTIILAIAIPLVAALAFIILCCTCCLKKKGASKTHEKAGTEELVPLDSLLFDLSTIRNATDNFSESNKLGEGGFGEVYKGKLLDGQEIAAKRLSASSFQGLTELRNEVVLLLKLQHRNLVRLLGVCLEEEAKILIYEFVQNKSLDKILFDTRNKDQLDWKKRYKIINGIARGMLYLHEESQVKIIHRDLKASNILLDANMNPKISDFGLARLLGGDDTQASTNRVVGTFGYMSPEYAMKGQFSNKSDVFSFGVLVLEIVTGRKNNDSFSSGHSTDLLGHVWENWQNGSTLEVIDPYFEGQYPHGEAIRCIHIGLLCVQEDQADRPTMSAVNLMLNSYSVSVHPPSRPAFVFGHTRVGSNNQGEKLLNPEGTIDWSTTKSAHYSANEVSITEMEPR